MENSSIAEKTREIVRANGYEGVIDVIKGRVEDIELPDGATRVDVIVSEWMGYSLVYENMLASVLYARSGRYIHAAV